MVVITLTYFKPLVEIDALMRQHVSWLKRYYTSGLFIASGRQKPRSGGIILAKSGDLKEVEAAMEVDPLVKAGVATFALCEFIPSTTAPGAEVLPKL
jgi:uncharacterized protein YciI